MIRTCRHCEQDFDLNSRAKREVGGKIDECPMCVEELGTETATSVVGVVSGDGKSAMVTVMRFSDEETGARFLHMWRRSTGYYRGKSCQMGSTVMLDMDGMGKKIGEHGGNANHKGNRSDY